MNTMGGVAEYERVAPRRHASQRAQTSRAQYDQEKQNYRTLEARRYRDNRPGMERDHHGGSNHPILLDDALIDLQDALETAVDYYSSFIEDFDRDVQRIKPYAGTQVMQHLWVHKTLLNDERSRYGGRLKARQADGPNLERSNPSHSFQNVNREVLSCFLLVTGSRSSSRESSIDPQSADRIWKKFEQASRDIFELMRTAVKQKADADALVTEMEMLLTFLEKTRPLQGHRGNRDHHRDPNRNKCRDQNAEDYDRPHGHGSDGQGGFKEEQGTCTEYLSATFIDKPQSINNGKLNRRLESLHGSATETWPFCFNVSVDHSLRSPSLSWFTKSCPLLIAFTNHYFVTH